MTIVKIEVPCYEHRKNILTALALTGYKSWQEEIETYFIPDKQYFVCFDPEKPSREKKE